MADTLDITFNGNDAEECSRFIRAVRKFARVSGKIWDYAWIAEQVCDAFDGRALYWYLKQPQNVQEDWALLQAALITEWPHEGVDAKERQASNIPIPAPAAQGPGSLAATPPSSSFRHFMDGKIGRLRVRGGMTRRSDKFLSKHVWTGDNRNTHMRGSFMLTPDPTEAQAVKLIEVKPGVWRLGLENHPSSRLYIAAFAYSGSYKEFYGALVGTNATNGKPIKAYQTTYIGDKSNKSYYDQEFWTDVWQLEDDRYLTLSGPPGALGKYKVPLVIMPQNQGIFLWFRGKHASDSDGEKEVEFEFEPISA